jgi:ferredoxin
MRVQIDPGLCQGHGRCYDLAPDVFGEDDDGYAVLLCDGGVVPPELQDDARLAVANCPEEALEVEEDVA